MAQNTCVFALVAEVLEQRFALVQAGLVPTHVLLSTDARAAIQAAPLHASVGTRPGHHDYVAGLPVLYTPAPGVVQVGGRYDPRA